MRIGAQIFNVWRVRRQVNLHGYGGLPGSFEEQKTYIIPLRVSCDLPITEMLKMNPIFVVDFRRLDGGNVFASSMC